MRELERRDRSGRRCDAGRAPILRRHPRVMDGQTRRIVADGWCGMTNDAQSVMETQHSALVKFVTSSPGPEPSPAQADR